MKISISGFAGVLYPRLLKVISGALAPSADGLPRWQFYLRSRAISGEGSVGYTNIGRVGATDSRSIE